MAQVIKVLIVDDHFVARKGIHALLAEAKDIEVVGEAGDGREAVAQARRLEPDIVLMDLVMPRMDGAEATREILDRGPPGVRVMVLTGFDLDHKILAAIRAGALGYVSKSSSQEELLNAIRQVHQGVPWLPAHLTRRLLYDLDRPDPAPLEPLTRRESEVLRLVATGLSNQKIAESIGIAEMTVRTHVSRVLGKLGLKNRVEATLYALRTGLASLEEAGNGSARP